MRRTNTHRIKSSWGLPNYPGIIVHWVERGTWRAASDTEFFIGKYGLVCSELDLRMWGWQYLSKGYLYENKKTKK